MRRREFLTAVAAIGITPAVLPRALSEWRAGVATVDITPDRSLWMAGFAARTEPSQGVSLPLHAKALAAYVPSLRVLGKSVMKAGTR